MTEPLFYSEILADTGAVVVLAGDEARHAAASRRLRAGDTLWLFDGRGGLARATLLQVTARGRTLDLRVEERRTEPRPRPVIHLACALPKGDRQGVLLDMATQLGMTRFTPLICERSVVKAGANNADRWRRICLEACKQSRRTHLPELSPPATPREVIARKTGNETVWIAHPSAGAISVSSALRQADPERVTILIGPEGGFTETEVGQVLAGGGQKIALDSAILRIETAAVALVAALSLADGTRAL